MKALDCLARHFDRCVHTAKATVVTSFNEEARGTREKAIETFWALKDAQDMLRKLQRQEWQANQEKELIR